MENNTDACGDAFVERSRADLEAFLATASPHLADLITAALEDGPGTDAWADAEFELGTRSVPS